jgi:hypothetical protein
MLLAGCIEDDYRCTSDAQCNLGEAGRCELDGRCTAFDDDCASNRRYTEHSGAVSETCFDDAVVPLNPCADGQPPALPIDACFAAVCEAVPACCLTGWSSACVQQAQLRCPEVACDTRIAITAETSMGTELWDVRSVDGITWTTTPVAGSLVAWLAPAPGTTDPRLARVDVDGLFVDDALIPLVADRRYNDITSVDVDRSGHDTLVLGSTASDPTTPVLEIFDLTTGVSRELVFEASSRIEWGDYDHDAFPDAVIATTGPTYLGAINVLADADPQRGRVFAPGARANVAGNITPQQSPAVRSLAWADLDGDHTLDLIVGGNSIRVHLAEQTSTNQPIVTDEVSLTADCHPTVTTGVGQCVQEDISFASAVVPRDGGSEIVLVSFPQPEAHLLSITRGTPVTGTLTPILNCPTCAPLIAIVARDVNHDGVLDLVAIDQGLGLWTMLSPATELTFVTQIRPPTPRVRSIRVSVGGGF